jgi:hypothetical protein
VDIGDDAIVVASYLDLASDGKPLPAENILVRNCNILSRNLAIGAGTSGGIRNVTFEDCAVVDDLGSSPWTFKIKSQTNTNATIEGITVRRSRALVPFAEYGWGASSPTYGSNQSQKQRLILGFSMGSHSRHCPFYET